MIAGMRSGCLLSALILSLPACMPVANSIAVVPTSRELSVASAGRAKPEPQPQLGAHRLRDERSITNEYRCLSKTRPFVVLERNEISLSVVRSGESFRHEFVYALCPETPGMAVHTTLTRSVTHGGKILLTDQTKDFQMRPGRWVVSALIEVPVRAKPGEYRLELRLIGQVTSLTAAIPFVVQHDHN